MINNNETTIEEERLEMKAASNLTCLTGKT